MKRNICFAILLVTGFSLSGQSHQDVLLFSDQSYTGTARSHAMGNAFGALGADMTSIHVNPAGLGVYRTFSMSATAGLGMREMSAYYQGNKSMDLSGNFNLTSFGLVSPAKRNPEGDWRRVNYSFTYNKTNVFKSSLDVSGYNKQSSLVDVFSDYAQGVFIDNLNQFYEGGAFWVDLIDLELDTAGEWIDDGAYFREVEAGQHQRKISNTSGSMGEYQFSYAGSYKEKLYIGASIGLSTIDYLKETYYQESDFADTVSTVQSFYMRDDVYISGAGVNLKIGGILRVNDQLRLGLSWHSPTLYNMQDEWQMKIDAQHQLNDSAYSYSHTSPYGIYNYEIVTPMKITTSAALVLNKKLVLSGDIEFIDYTTMQLNGNDYDYFEEQNQVIANTYTSTYNARLGVELNLSPIVLRAGYAKYGNPIYRYDGAYMYQSYNGDPHRTERQAWSIGIGKRNQYSYVDVAYSFTENNQTDMMYNESYVVATKLVNTYQKIILTLGWKF